MIVFKNYLKVAKSFLPIIIVYTLIFVGIATISSTSGAQNTDAFEASESRIAFINHDQESSFINSFQKYIIAEKHFKINSFCGIFRELSESVAFVHSNVINDRNMKQM